MGTVGKSVRSRLAGGVAFGALLVLGSTAGAQTTSATEPPAPNAENAAPAPPPPSAVSEIVVTGSRVITNGNNQPTPVTVVSADQLLRSNPTSVTAALQTLPAFQGMRSPSTAPGNSRQNNAARVLNLRNLGRLRTLAMFDGHRLAPSSPEAETDTAFIPSMLLERVDVVTGGASSVYGSDAVAGVVNFITNRNFNGIKADVHYGISERNDAPEYKAGIAAGTSLFGGRGHIEGSYEYLRAPGIPNKLEREFGRNVFTLQGAGTAAAPYIYIANTRLSNRSYNGYITAANPAATNPLRDMVFSSNGVLTPFQHGTPVVTGTLTVANIEQGGDGVFYNKVMLVAESDSHVGFLRFDYDLADNLHFYANVSGWRTHNRNTNINNEFANISLRTTNAFLTPAQQFAMRNVANGLFTFSRTFDNVPPQDSETIAKGFMGTVGLEGTLGKFKWDAFYAPSRNTQRTWNNANINNEKALAALDAVVGANGQIQCYAATQAATAATYANCVPLNLFGPTSFSQAAIDYIIERTEFTAATEMHEVGGSIAGSPFDTWAGPLDIALSANWRKLTYDQVSNALPISAVCTNIRNNCTAATLKYAGNVMANLSPVSQTVKEVAGEVNVPLLKDLPIAETLNLNGALRYTDYDTSGTVWTWKIGVDWHVTPWLTIRGTRSRDIRAPNLPELFAPDIVQTGTTRTDPFLGTPNSAPQITRANPNLEPEVAQVWTAGIVIKPTFLPRFTLAIDGYKIKINNAITAIQGTDVNIQRLCTDSNGTSPYCELIPRTPGGPVTAFLSQPRNALRLQTEGVDVELNYRTPLLGGNLALRGLLSYQPHEWLALPIGARLDAAGAAIGPCCQLDGLSKTRISLFADWEHGNFYLNLQERWASGLKWDPNPNLVFNVPDLPAVAYTNVTVGYKLNAIDMFLSVQNLFDKQPTPFGRTSHTTIPGLMGGFVPGQDLIGRYYTVGARVKF